MTIVPRFSCVCWTLDHASDWCFMKLDHGWVLQQNDKRTSGCRNGEIQEHIQLQGGDINNVNY